MPEAPQKPCNYPGCNKLTTGTYCSVHQAKADAKRKQSYQHRESSKARGYGRDWQKVRDQYLEKVGWIAECKRCPIRFKCGDKGRVITANTIHHIKPVTTHPHLRLDESNFLAVSRMCHERIEGRKYHNVVQI